MEGSDLVTLKKNQITVASRKFQLTIPAPPSTSISALPDDVLVEIICRLPIKHMSSCKCINKLWHLLITHVCIPRITLSPVSGLVINTIPSVSALDPKKGPWSFTSISSSNYHHSIDSYLDETFLVSGLPFRPSPEAFLDCCDGLLLYFYKALMQYYVCNPSTEQYIAIPNSPGNNLPTSAGLFFDSHYKIMNISGNPPTMNIFSLVTREWSVHKLNLESSFVTAPFTPRYTFLDGSMYLLCLLGYLFKFDIKQKNHQVCKLPDIVKRSYRPIGCLGVSQGILHYCWDDKKTNMMIWIVNAENGHPVEWTLKYNICIQYFLQHPISRCHRGFPWYNVVAFHPTSDKVFVASFVGIFLYDPCTKELEIVCTLNEGKLILASQYFVHLFRPNITSLDELCQSTLKDSAVNTLCGSGTVSEVGTKKEFDLKLFLKEVEAVSAGRTLQEGISRGHHYLIDGEYFDGVTIFRSLVPPRHARVSKTAFQQWRRQVGRLLLRELNQAGIYLDMNFYDKDPQKYYDIEGSGGCS